MARAPKRAAPSTEYVRPREAFFGLLDPKDEDSMVSVGATEVILASDPVVKRWPDKFVPLEPSRQRPAVEQATAAPGEGRPVNV